MDVPLNTANPPPGMEELIDDPGATSERNGAALEKDDTTSSVVVDPTLTAVEMQAGTPRESRKPSFPAAIVVATPTDRRLSMIGFRRSLSQFAKKRPPPILILTAPRW